MRKLIAVTWLRATAVIVSNIMDGIKKQKKPRIRNRPRNKANIMTSQEKEGGIYREESITVANSNIKSVKYQGSDTDFSETIKCIQHIIRQRLLQKVSKKAVVHNKSETSKKNKSEATNNNLAAQLIDVISCQGSQSGDKSVEVDIQQQKQIFINALQRKAESVFSKGGANLPELLLNNLQKLFQKEPLPEAVSSDEEVEEYIEYIYKPRQYFIVSLCNFCRCDLLHKQILPCSRCSLVYYCCKEHEKSDEGHKQLCYGLKRMAESYNGHIFYKCSDFTNEQFRSYRIIAIRKAEDEINRTLSAMEQEILLFPRLCNNTKCREYRFEKLKDCKYCGQVFYCNNKPDHLNSNHKYWCRSFKIFKDLVMFQHNFGRLEPSMPTKILKELPTNFTNTKDIFNRLNLDLQDSCEYAALTQLSTAPLTAWFALKLTDQLKHCNIATIHLIGAEIEFEVDVLHKWELFFLHITPNVQELNIVFIGPELKSSNISFENLQKTKCCRLCRKNCRTIHYHFENHFYHDYCSSEKFLKPSLVCFYNAGLYRQTGYQLEDTWPDSILAASNIKCPIVVTSYTEYEAPLDLARFIQDSNRYLTIILPPIINPFASYTFVFFSLLLISIQNLVALLPPSVFQPSPIKEIKINKINNQKI